MDINKSNSKAEEIQKEIVSRLSRVKVLYKAFLFGSYAYGTPDADSDLDLLVVLDKETTPKNFQERSENYSILDVPAPYNQQLNSVSVSSPCI